ncbi:MAG: hypothetical protein QM619_04665 [Micropruina sp.]|uniref:hypothetical protein n=1 Tax=Micropruina sp. TaxID=2737536 RepID=UPI0039E686FA
MSSADFREPTNEQLWSQPPAGAPTQQGGGMLPAQPAPPPQHAPHHPYPPAPQQPRQDKTVFVLAVVSLAIGVPLTAISAGAAGLPGLLIAWIGIVMVNLIYARSRRKQG